MRRTLLTVALMLVTADLSYGQTCQAFINGARARMSKNKWADARQVLAEQLPNCQDSAEFQYLYAIALVQVSPDSSARAVTLLNTADSLIGKPAAGKDLELQANIEQALAALWGPAVNEGVRLLQAGRVDEAQQKLELAVQMNPEGKEARLALGAVYQTKNEFDRAIEHFRKALDIDPTYKGALLRLGSAYQMKADAFASSGDSAKVAQASIIAQQAVQLYEDYLKQYPGEMDAQIQLAGLYATLGQLEKAEPIIREVMQSDSVSAEVLTDFGFRLTNAHQYDLAEELLKRAIVMTDSLSVEPLSYLVFIRIQKGDLEGARTILKKQIELEPSNAQAWEYLAYAERDLGNTTAAEEAFRKAESIPLELEALRLGQSQDQTWNVEATFSNRSENPVHGITVRFTLISEAGQALETKEARVASSKPLASGEAESVSIQFTKQDKNARVTYEILM